MNSQLAALAAGQHGVFTRAQAIDSGFSPAETRQRIEARIWSRVRHGVYVDGPLPADREELHLVRCAAAVLAMPHLVISHESAARLRGWALLEPPPPVVSGLSRSWGGRTKAGVHVRQTHLPDAQIGSARGLPTTSGDRTVVDLAASLRFEPAVVVADHALHSGASTRAGVLAVLAALGQSVPQRAVQRVIDAADALAESPGESLTRLLLIECGFPTPRAQVQIGPYRVDFLLDGTRVVVEFDGRIKYDDPDALWREKQREDWLRAQGYEVVRLTWDDVRRHPERAAALVQAALQRSLAA